MQVYASVYGVTGAVSVLLVRSPLRTRRPSSSPKLNADVDPCFGMTATALGMSGMQGAWALLWRLLRVVPVGGESGDSLVLRLTNSWSSTLRASRPRKQE